MTTKKKILLVKHTYIDGWYLPGGGVKKFEEPADALSRELREEIVFSPTEIELFGVYSNFAESKSDTIIILKCSGIFKKNVKSKEIEKCEFFDLEKLPEDTSPGTVRRIAELSSVKSGIISKW